MRSKLQRDGTRTVGSAKIRELGDQKQARQSRLLEKIEGLKRSKQNLPEGDRLDVLVADAGLYR